MLSQQYRSGNKYGLERAIFQATGSQSWLKNDVTYSYFLRTMLEFFPEL